MKAATTILKIFFLATFLFSGSEAIGQGYSIIYSISPPVSEDGNYISGERVEISFSVSVLFGDGNYPHGFFFNFPPIFDPSLVEVINTPEGCGPGYWAWYDQMSPVGSSQVYGPGFFYDSPHGSPEQLMDSLPGNNFGDPCGTFSAFTFEITLTDSCVVADSTDLNLWLIMTSDGTTGSWALDGPTYYFDFNGHEFNYDCCTSGYAGENARDVQYCENEPTCLMDFITEEQLVDSGGFWTGPDNWTSDEYCDLFDPFVNKEGTYRYTVETDGCTRQSKVEISFYHLEELEPSIFCGPDIVNLYDEICVSNNLPLNGTWFYPNDENNDLSEQLVDGLLSPELGDTGVYTYFFQDDSQCYSKVKVSIEMRHIYFPGEETWADVCEDQGQFCPFEMLDGNPESGGQWIVTDAEGQYISFHTNYDVCLETSSFSTNFICSYIIGANPCTSYITPLHFNLIDSSSCVEPLFALSGTYDDEILSCVDQNMEIWIYEAGTSNQISSSSTIFSDGSFTTLWDVPAATYDIYIKIDGFLSKAFENIDLGPVGTELEMGALIKGDINNDDGINIIDVSIINSAFGTGIADVNYNYLADLNCDGGVNIIDISALNVGFNFSGAHTQITDN